MPTYQPLFIGSKFYSHYASLPQHRQQFRRDMGAKLTSIAETHQSSQPRREASVLQIIPAAPCCASPYITCIHVILLISSFHPYVHHSIHICTSSFFFYYILVSYFLFSVCSYTSICILQMCI
jgi:hypothetical protein